MNNKTAFIILIKCSVFLYFVLPSTLLAGQVNFDLTEAQILDAVLGHHKIAAVKNNFLVQQECSNNKDTCFSITGLDAYNHKKPGTDKYIYASFTPALKDDLGDMYHRTELRKNQSVSVLDGRIGEHIYFARVGDYLFYPNNPNKVLVQIYSTSTQYAPLMPHLQLTALPYSRKTMKAGF